MDASGALDSLLGRLATVLVTEAQLLGGVRSDVEFIKDEMESMNGLILHLTEAQYRDHQVRAWMKQVVGLTRDCEGNVELYVHYVGSRPGDGGLLGFLCRITRFLQTIPVRHRIATRIQELKVRARDVGDRRQRYGVTVPASTRADMDVVDVEPSGGKQDLRRRAVLLYVAEPPAVDVVIRSGIDALNKCVSTKPATTEDEGAQAQVKVFCILGDGHSAHKVAEGVYQRHSCVASVFGCKALSDGSSSVQRAKQTTTTSIVLAEILKQVGVQLQPGQEEDDVSNQAETSVDEDALLSRDHEKKQLISKIKGHLKGKRFLIVVNTRGLYSWKWKATLDALLDAADGCLPGSAIIMTTEEYKLALSSSPYKIIHPRDLEMFYSDKAQDLNADMHIIHHEDITKYSAFARKMLLHLLYVKPAMTEAELGMCQNAISKGLRLHNSVDHTMVMLCYNEVPSKYRSCLLYLTLFPEGHVIKTTRLARRWIAEDLLVTTTSDETESEADKGGHYSDVLFIRGFISPVEISAAGNIKSFTVKDEVHKVLAKIAKEVNIVDTNLPTDLARRLSIHNRIVLPKSHSIADSTDIVASLQSLAASSQWQLLKVLDLEGCQGLEKQHLKTICKIILLKYLSLRNTDVTELPKQIKELQCLETLDVRETKVQVLAKKATVLPLLKHFLAGHKVSATNESTTSEDSFSAVEMPLHIEKMNNMEILSHVRVSNSKELDGINQLQKLRKLGVALHGNHAKLGDLFCQIEKLHRCLRSLSIRFVDVGNVDPLSAPKFIRSLNVSGLTSGCITHMIQELHVLSKLTLTETYLKEDGLRILGKLRGLRFLRLQKKAYTESELSFKEEEFQALNFLLVGTTNVTNISFATGVTPKLERIVWSFATTACVSGLGHLYELREFELNGDCNPDQVRDEINRITLLPFILEYKDRGRRKFPVFKHNPHVQRSYISGQREKEISCLQA